jgi:hypothetical protein
MFEANRAARQMLPCITNVSLVTSTAGALQKSLRVDSGKDRRLNMNTTTQHLTDEDLEAVVGGDTAVQAEFRYGSFHVIWTAVASDGVVRGSTMTNTGDGTGWHTQDWPL